MADLHMMTRQQTPEERHLERRLLDAEREARLAREDAGALRRHIASAQLWCAISGAITFGFYLMWPPSNPASGAVGMTLFALLVLRRQP